MPHLVNNQAGRADKVGQKVALPAGSACGSHAVPQLCHLNEVTPKSMFTAGTPKSLGQMGLARTRPSNKGKVFVSIEGRQRGEATELVNILSGDSAEIKVVKGLGDLQWEAAGAEQEIHCGTLPLFQEIVKYLCHGEGFSIGHVVLLYQHYDSERDVYTDSDKLLIFNDSLELETVLDLQGENKCFLLNPDTKEAVFAGYDYDGFRIYDLSPWL